MKSNQWLVAAFIALAIFLYSCGNANTTHVGNTQNENDGHNHTEMVQAGAGNDKGALVDGAGNIVVGCLMHKEMIGSEGNLCPKCNYMKMVPVTWSLDGIDTVRVTSLADYNPPKK